MSVDPKQFAISILHGVGAPVTHANVASLVGWSQAEGGAVHNNPFNTTESAPGASSMNSVGVKTYPNYDEAVNATIATLKNGRYGGIIGALKSSNPNAFVAAVGSSPWGTSGSLLSSTVHDALGQNYGLTPGEQSAAVNVARTKAAIPATQPQTTVSAKTTGGTVDYKAALAQALLTPVKINTTTGALPTGDNILSRAMSLAASGQYTTPTTNTINTRTVAGQQAITGKAVNDAAVANAPQDVQHLLKMIHNVNGSPYSTLNHDDINERDVNIKKAGTDCSGFVSWLMGPHGLGIWKTSLATPSIDTAPGIQPGKGKQITIWNNSNPGASGHVFIQIGTGSKAQWWASEGGGVGIHQLPLSEVQNYWANGSDGGHYVALHPKGL